MDNEFAFTEDPSLKDLGSTLIVLDEENPPVKIREKQWITRK